MSHFTLPPQHNCFLPTSYGFPSHNISYLLLSIGAAIEPCIFPGKNLGWMSRGRVAPFCPNPTICAYHFFPQRNVSKDSPSPTSRHLGFHRGAGAWQRCGPFFEPGGGYCRLSHRSAQMKVFESGGGSQPHAAWCPLTATFPLRTRWVQRRRRYSAASRTTHRYAAPRPPSSPSTLDGPAPMLGRQRCWSRFRCGWPLCVRQSTICPPPMSLTPLWAGLNLTPPLEVTPRPVWLVVPPPGWLAQPGPPLKWLSSPSSWPRPGPLILTLWNTYPAMIVNLFGVFFMGQFLLGWTWPRLTTWGGGW